MTLKEVHDFIKDICERHKAVAQFKSGYEASFDDKSNLYPLTFLERDFMIALSTDSSQEKYSIRLTVADKASTAAADSELIQITSKAHQIAKQIYSKIKKEKKGLEVAAPTFLTNEEKGNDLVCMVRMEFTISVGAGVLIKDLDTLFN